MILVDNTFCLTEDKEVVQKDKDSETILVSHGHYDHLPTRTRNARIICSKLTERIVRVRVPRKTITFGRDSNIEMLDSGHVLGGKMFYFNDKKLLYTGDFNTVTKYCGVAKPKKCKTLVVESTFGKEQYVFPKYENVTRELKDYVQDHRKVIINAYTFGKSQEVSHLLNKFKIPFSVSDRIAKMNNVLGLKFDYEDDKHGDVIIGDLQKDGHKNVGVSGWAIDSGYKYVMGFDEAFPLSNHADYPSIVEFIKKCRPEKIITFHGFSVELAGRLQKAGYNAEPMLRSQKLLGQFLKA